MPSWELGFVALVVLPDISAAVHASLVRVAHVVVRSGVLPVQTLPVEVISYFYCGGGGEKKDKKVQLFGGFLDLVIEHIEIFPEELHSSIKVRCE